MGDTPRPSVGKAEVLARRRNPRPNAVPRAVPAKGAIGLSNSSPIPTLRRTQNQSKAEAAKDAGRAKAPMSPSQADNAASGGEEWSLLWIFRSGFQGIDLCFHRSRSETAEPLLAGGSQSAR